MTRDLEQADYDAIIKRGSPPLLGLLWSLRLAVGALTSRRED